MLSKYILLILLISSLAASGQGKYLITGTVQDDSTKMPIPYVSIGNTNGNNSGTISNLDGEFELKLDSLPQKLSFRHISYKPLEIEVGNQENMSVNLLLATLELKTVVVDANLPYQYVKKAYEKAVSQKDIEYYGNAFYRQVTFNKKTPVEILEAFFQTQFSNQGIKRRDMQQGRYAIKKETVMRLRNFSYLTAVKSFYPEIKGMIFPTVANPEKYYEMQMEGYFQQGQNEYVKISYIPKSGLDKPALEGTIVINSDNYHIINISGKVVSPPIPLLSFNIEGYDSKNQIYSFELNFREKDNFEIPILDNIMIGLNFDLYKDSTYLGKTEVNGTLIIYDLVLNGKRLNKIRKEDTDIEAIENTDYNPSFWKNNPIIKRTPAEQKLINSFDENNSFGTIVNEAN